MRSLVAPLVERESWLTEFGLDRYGPDEQNQLWDLVTRALEMQALDTLLDRLTQQDQQGLIQHLAEDDLDSQVEAFLDRVLPQHHQLLEHAVVAYKEQLRKELTRLKS
jgi:hypothetical protein